MTRSKKKTRKSNLGRALKLKRAVLRDVQHGARVHDICTKYGVSKSAVYDWISKRSEFEAQSLDAEADRCADVSEGDTAMTTEPDAESKPEKRPKGRGIVPHYSPAVKKKVLRAVASGRRIEDVCAEYQVSRSSVYTWSKKRAEIEASVAEDEPEAKTDRRQSSAIACLRSAIAEHDRERDTLAAALAYLERTQR